VSVLGSAAARAHRSPVDDLAAYLAGEYRAGVPWRLTVRHTTATGQELHDRLVSRLEVANALRYLSYRQRRVIELLYDEDRPVVEVAGRLGVSPRTVWADRLEALGVMTRVIYDSSWWTQEDADAD
jgi:DNA-directed RNA polymerase specialized sigma24 family protein